MIILDFKIQSFNLNLTAKNLGRRFTKLFFSDNKLMFI